MENASKALLIAGGVLIVIILVSMIMLVKNNVTNFYASQDELQEIADKTKFNEQFTRFNRDDVAGYELISLVNKVIDYNERISNASSEGNDNQAEPISLSITLWKNNGGKDRFINLVAHRNKLYLFDTGTLIEKSDTLNKDSNNTLKSKLDKVKNIESSNPKIRVIEKRLSDIIVNLDKTHDGKEVVEKSKLVDYSGFPDDLKIIENNRKKMIEAIGAMNSALGANIYVFNATEDLEDPKVVYDKYMEFATTQNIKSFCMYHEYIQFTKAKFKCSKIDYNNETGKVNNLEFKFTGEIE